jgi:nucleoside-diphosphate-sugar epimerase
VNLILKVIEHPKAAGQIFLVSDDHDISTATLLRSTSFFLGKNIKLFPVPIFALKVIFFLTGKKDFFQRLVASLSLDIRKTKRLLNWSPPYSYEEGINATAQDFLQNIKKDSSGK